MPLTTPAPDCRSALLFLERMLADPDWQREFADLDFEKAVGTLREFLGRMLRRRLERGTAETVRQVLRELDGAAVRA